MKNLAIIPNVLTDTYELMDAICKQLPIEGNSTDVLRILSSYHGTINKIVKQMGPLIAEYNLLDKINSRYNDIKLYASQQKEYALPILAWEYFTQSVILSTEETIASNVIQTLPIVDFSFEDYYLGMN